MKQTFKLQKGEISFEEDKITIRDDSRKQRRLLLLLSCGWTFYGVISVLRYLKTGDQFLLWTGLFIGIAHLAIFVVLLFRTSRSEISRSEIKALKVKQRFGNTFLAIYLKGCKVRQVIRVENKEELEKYVESYRKTI